MKTQNKHYDIALRWVKEKYPFLFVNQILSITLVHAKDAGNWLGLHIRSCEGNGDGVSEIKIRNGQYTTEEFVSTIVHELVHACQYYTGKATSREQMESHAEDLSTEAYMRYKKENNIPIWR